MYRSRGLHGMLTLHKRSVLSHSHHNNNNNKGVLFRASRASMVLIKSNSDALYAKSKNGNWNRHNSNNHHNNHNNNSNNNNNNSNNNHNNNNAYNCQQYRNLFHAIPFQSKDRQMEWQSNVLAFGGVSSQQPPPYMFYSKRYNNTPASSTNPTLSPLSDSSKPLSSSSSSSLSSSSTASLFSSSPSSSSSTSTTPNATMTTIATAAATTPPPLPIIPVIPPALAANAAEAAQVNSKAIKKNKDKVDKRAYPIAFSSLLMGVAIGIVIPVMPQLANEIGINTLQYGLVLAMMGWTRLLFNIPAAWAVDRIGRRPILITGPVLTSFGMTMTATAHSFSELLGWRFLVGAGGSISMAGSQSYLADISTVENRARTLSPSQVGFSAGMALGPALGGLLAETLGIRNCFIAVGATISGVVLNHYIMCPETLPHSKLEDRKNLQLSGIAQEFKATLKQWKPLWNDLNIRSAIYMHSLFWFTSGGCMFTLLPLYATNTLHMSLSSLGSLFAIVALINVVGSQPIAWFGDKFGRKIVIPPSIFVLSSAAFLLPYVETTQQLTWLAVWWGIGSTMFQSTPMAYVSDKSERHNRSQALAILRSGGDFGLMLGSGLCASIAQFYDIRMATTFAATCLFLGGCNFTLKAK